MYLDNDRSQPSFIDQKVLPPKALTNANDPNKPKSFLTCRLCAQRYNSISQPPAEYLKFNWLRMVQGGVVTNKHLAECRRIMKRNCFKSQICVFML